MVEFERRKRRRRKAKPGMVLEYRPVRRLPLLKARYRPFGAVVDLSANGITVEYPDRELRPMERVEFALSVPGAGLRMEGISLFAVTDFIVADETACGGSACRRRGFRFGTLSQSQKRRLGRILRNHTVGSPGP